MLTKRVMIKKVQEKINNFLGNHLSHLLACAWLSDFKVTFKSSKDASEAELKDFTGTKSAYMTNDVDYEYLTSHITYNKDKLLQDFLEKKFSNIIDILSHEIAHIVTGEAFDKLNIKYTGDGRFYQERLTERVGRYIYRLYMFDYVTDNKINIQTGKPYAKQKKRQTKKKNK